MPDTAQSESIKDLLATIEAGRLVLPEFQRDFVWDVTKTYDLFDSLARNIFVGPLIYGVPSFAITARELDSRPRKGHGSRRRLLTRTYTPTEIESLKQTLPGFRLILDGQQRITALNRALTGADEVWFIAQPTESLVTAGALETALDEFAGSESEERLSISLADVWKIVQGELRREAAKRELLQQSLYIRTLRPTAAELDQLFERYLALTEALQDLLKAEKLLSYYLLDTSVEKFALFFERSNTKGIRLTFIDILAAKLYSGFNLREHIEAFEEEHPQLQVNKEHVVRMVAYLASAGTEVKKSYILEHLTPGHFDAYWPQATALYAKVVQYLLDNHWIISQALMPYDNMLVPLMAFLDALPSKLFSQATADQIRTVEYWYWASLFSERYSARTNETILEDAGVLSAIVRGEAAVTRTYLRRFINQVQTQEDVIDIKTPGSALFKATLSLVHRRCGGLRDWRNGQGIARNEFLDGHHIFPRRYLKEIYQPSPEPGVIDSVANRAFIPKITNVKIGRKAPSVYLRELAEGGNTAFADTLASHLIDPNFISGTYDDAFPAFVEDRAGRLFKAIQESTVGAAEAAVKPFLAE